MATIKVKVKTVVREKVNGTTTVVLAKRPKLNEIRPVAK